MPWWLIRVYIDGLDNEFSGKNQDDDDFYNEGPPTGDVDVVDDISTLGAVMTEIQ